MLQSDPGYIISILQSFHRASFFLESIIKSRKYVMIKEDTYPFSSFVTFTETSVTTNNTLAPSGTSSPPKIGAESYFHNA